MVCRLDEGPEAEPSHDCLGYTACRGMLILKYEAAYSNLLLHDDLYLRVEGEELTGDRADSRGEPSDQRDHGYVGVYNPGLEALNFSDALVEVMDLIRRLSPKLSFVHNFRQVFPPRDHSKASSG